MASYTTTDLRNLALLGSPGSGKTTLVEQMLHHAGAIHRLGRVEDGNTVCDHSDMEKESGCSLDSAVVHYDHGGAHVNLIDTPGQGDFLGKSFSVLPAVEAVLGIVDASSSIDPVIRRVMKIAAERNLPRVIVINKIDHATDLPGLLASIRELFGSECLPINLPAEGGSSVIDCFRSSEGSSDLGEVETFHTEIVEQVVEMDEVLMEQYLEEGSIDPAALHGPFKQALCDGHLVPVCFTSATADIGVRELMDIISQLLPNPTEGNPRPFVRGEGDEAESYTVTQDASEPLVAHVFKVSSDPYVGRLSVFRVHQGRIDSSVQPVTKALPKGIRISHVFKLQGKEHKESEGIIAGDIGALAKIDELQYDDTLTDPALGEGLHLDSIPLPKPMYGLALVGTKKGAEAKMGEALRKLTVEDPTLVLERNQTTGETVLWGIGEQHLRIKLQILSEQYGVEVETHPPKIAYKETIRRVGEGHHRHKKQTGGPGQFGEVYLRVEPLGGDGGDGTNGLDFVNDTVGGSVPRQFMPAIEKGITQVMLSGAVAGYHIHNIKVSVYDGKHHPVDSKEVAFMTAGRKAFIDAVKKAQPILLEPYVSLEITVPADQIGDISSDMSGRRGRILGTDMLPGNMAIVSVEAPLGEVTTYSQQLKSMSGGAGSFTMEYVRDEETPSNVQAEIVARFQPHGDEN